jgi:hypothetical protein
LAWPPPYLYGLVTIRLAAAIAFLTAGGASAGAMALPLRTFALPVGGW